MANLYTVLPGLQPTQQEIIQAELLAKQILEAQFPDLDLREGTGLRDLVLRPNAFMLALINKGLNYYFAQNTLRGIDNSTPQEIVDNIMSNWFLTRNLGTYAVINARLYFARQKNVSISSSVYFSPDNTLLYYPLQSVTLPASAMSFDAYANEWYIDIDLQAAQQGTEYNLSSGSLLYFSTFDPYFLRAEINYLASSSIAGETNEEFIARAETAISTRNLINNPSIISNLQAQFNYLRRLVPIGMGDREMIRDQLKAVFDPEPPRLITNLSSAGTTATAVLPDHGWHTGQIVQISGAAPAEYNGTYSITVIDSSTFTYEMMTPASIVTLFPTVQSVTAPTLLHNGGMIDIYCDDSRANSIVQLTTNESGTAVLTGPIYRFSRSEISGGTEEDTIPFEEEVNYSSITVDAPNKVLHVSAQSHGFANGQLVTLSGLEQTLDIDSISCSNITVTVVAQSHGLTGDTKIVVDGVTPPQYNGEFTASVVDADTLTYIVPANIPTAGTGTDMKLINTSVAGTYAIDVLGPHAFDITIPDLWDNGVQQGTAVLTYKVPYSVSNPHLRTQEITAMSCSGTTVTVTLDKHGQTANRYITISGATPDEYNGEWLIDSIISDSQFTFTVPQNIPTPASGTIVCTSVLPWYDYGFSSRQELHIHFGTAYANRTASFEIDYFPNVDSVQAYLEAPANRVLAADPLARGFNFYQLDISVVGYGGVAPSSGVVQEVAQAYLESLRPGEAFIMSDFVAALDDAGVTSIQTPPLVTYTKYTRDLITPITGTITDYLDPKDRTNVFLLGSVTTSASFI